MTQDELVKDMAKTIINLAKAKKEHEEAKQAVYNFIGVEECDCPFCSDQKERGLKPHFKTKGGK